MEYEKPVPKTLVEESTFRPVLPDNRADARAVGGRLLKLLADGYTVTVRGGIVQGAIMVTLRGERINPLYREDGP